MLFAVLFGFVLIGEVFMPAVMAVIAPGFGEDPAKFDGLVVTLTRITYPVSAVYFLDRAARWAPPTW